VGSQRIVKMMPLQAKRPAREFKQNLTALHTTLIRLALKISYLSQKYCQLPKRLHQMDQYLAHHRQGVENFPLFFAKKIPLISQKHKHKLFH